MRTLAKKTRASYKWIKELRNLTFQALQHASSSQLMKHDKGIQPQKKKAAQFSALA